MITKQFKPLGYTKKYVIYSRLKYGRKCDLSYFRNRLDWSINIMDRIFAKLHYLGSHSPTYSKKWIGIERRFLRRHAMRDF